MTRDSLRAYLADASTAVAPAERPEEARVPYTGPETPEEWRLAFAEMAADQPEEYADLFGQGFTR